MAALRVKTITGFKSYSENGTVESRGSNALMFVNEGDVVIKLEKLLTIKPGASFTISQVGTEAADFSMYKISFDLSHPSTTGTNQLLVLVEIGIIN